jgi:hypothetical protein
VIVPEWCKVPAAHSNGADCGGFSFSGSAVSGTDGQPGGRGNPPRSRHRRHPRRIPNATDDDLNYQHCNFIDYWRQTGKPMADWDAAWRNWIRKADELGELCRRANSMSRRDSKILGWLNAGQTQPTTQPEITP